MCVDARVLAIRGSYKQTLCFHQQNSTAFEYQKVDTDSAFVRLTVGVSGGWGEKGSETENCQRSEHAQKTRRVPAVRCTLCWAALIVYIDTIPVAHLDE